MCVVPWYNMLTRAWPVLVHYSIVVNLVDQSEPVVQLYKRAGPICVEKFSDYPQLGKAVQADPGLKATGFKILNVKKDNSAFNLNLVF